MANVESKILGRELGKLGGFGARLTARFLPNVAHEMTCDVAVPEEDARAAIIAILRELGTHVPELPQFSVVFGSGQMNLNPTIVSVMVSALPSGACVFLRGVAKEGAVKQDSAKKAVERVAALLNTRLSSQRT
jgi:predicted O-methyltransferase YrrM